MAFPLRFLFYKQGARGKSLKMRLSYQQSYSNFKLNFLQIFSFDSVRHYFFISTKNNREGSAALAAVGIPYLHRTLSTLGII